MKKYIIYIHTICGESYIGYTSKPLSERLHKHFTNAFYGIDTKFYRKIRKYGAANIVSKILQECNSQEEARRLEREYIKKYDTFKNGLNSTIGGDGGDIINDLSPSKYKKFIEKRKALSTGSNNPRYSGYTDEQLIQEAVNFFKRNNRFVFAHWFKYCKTKKMPLNYSKFRFGGKNRLGLLNGLKEKLTKEQIPFNDSSFEYDKTNESRRKNLSKAILGRHWYNNGQINYMIYPNDERIKLNNLKKGLIKNVKNQKDSRNL